MLPERNSSLEEHLKLDTFLSDIFIPKYIVRDYQEESYSYIPIESLLKLDLDQETFLYVLKYLETRGIPIKKKEIEESPRERLYKTASVLGPFSSSYQEKLFIDYYKTKDIKLRNELVKGNLLLVDYVIFQLNLQNSLMYEELVSFGYEGLIFAVSRFNPNLGYKFSTFAYQYIRGYILRNLVQSFHFPGKVYSQFLASKRKIEDEKGESLEENVQLVDMVLEDMQEKNEFSPRTYANYKASILFSLKISLHDVKEKSLIGYDAFLGVDRMVDFSILKEQLLDDLNEEEMDLLTLYCGLDRAETLTLKEISEIDEQSYRTVINKMRKIREKLRNNVYLKQLSKDR